MDEGEGKKIPRRGTDPSSHHCVDTILTFVTRVWISLQRLGRREKGNFLKGIAAIAADQPRLLSSRQKRRWERERGRGREQRKTNCGGRCAPSAPLLHPIAPHPIVFIATCEPTALNSVRLLQRNDRRRDYTHPLPASPYQTFVPNFHLFYRLAPTNFLPSFPLLLLLPRRLNSADSEFWNSRSEYRKWRARVNFLRSGRKGDGILGRFGKK